MKLSHNRSLSLGIVAVVAADWLTKAWVQERIPVDTRHAVVEGWIALEHRLNPGVSFSVLADAPHWWRLPLLAVAALVGIALCVRLIVQTADRRVQAAAAMVIAGAVGNLGDRLANGAVTDFILVRFFPFVFNVADVAITFGAILLAIQLLLNGDGPGRAEGQPA